jgi:hypothetical protein
MRTASINDTEYDLWKKLAGNLAGSGPTPPPFDNTILHVIITGQSNGRGTLPILTTVNADPRLLMFNGGIAPQDTPANLTSFVPLVESDAGLVVPYPYPGGETMCSSLGKFLIQFTSSRILFTQSVLNGGQYTLIKKGTQTYANIIAQVQAAKDLADEMGLIYRVLAVCAVHGEADQQFGNTNYKANVEEWQVDFDTDIKTITGQEDDVFLFACQQAGSAPDAGDSLNFTAASAILLEQANQDNSGSIIIPWPRYSTDHPDGLHLTAWGQRLMGEFYGKAIKASALNSIQYRPLSVDTANLVGDTITLTFHVPTPPLQFDLESVVFQPNYGFSYVDDDDSVEIASVVITGPDEVTITLTGTPTGANPEVRYACLTYLTSLSPKFGKGKGNLCDSDSTASNYGFDLKNFCTNFRRSL